MKTGVGTWLKGLCLSTLLLVTLVFAALVYVLDTPAGTRWLFARVGAFVPGSLHAKNIEGSLWRGVSIEAPRYQHERLQVSAERLHFAIEWPDLVHGQLVFTRVEAQALHYHDAGPPEPAAHPVTLSFQALPLGIVIKSLAVDQFSVSRSATTTLIRSLRAKRARLTGANFSVTEIAFAVEEVAVTLAQVSAQLNGQVPLRARLDWRAEQNKLSGSASIQGSLAKLTFEHTLEGPGEVRAQGALELLDRVDPLFDVNIVWNQWPVADYQLQQGRIKANGTPDDYVLSFETRVTGPRLAPVTVKGEAAGHSSGFLTTDIEANTETGSLRLSGPVTWSPEVTATMDLDLLALDAALLHPDLHGRLDGSAELLVSASNALELRAIDLTGHLNEKTVKGSGALIWTPEQWRCIACSLSVGENKLFSEGSYSEQQLAMRFSINAADLGQLWPDLAGSLSGEGTLLGPLEQPRFTGDLQGRQLHYGPWSAETLTLESKASSSTRLQIEASAQTLRHDDLWLGSPRVTARGSIDDLTFNLHWQRGDTHFTSDGKLSRGKHGVTGNLGGASLVEAHSGTWKLDRPLTFGYRDGLLILDAHHWTGDHGSLSLAKLQLGPEIQVAGQLRQLPLDTVNALLPEGYQVAGNVDAAVELVNKEGAWEGDISWRQGDTVVRITDPSIETTEVSIPLLNIDAKLAGGGAKALLRARVDPGIKAQLSATLTRLSRDTPIDAQLELEGDQWSWLPAVIPLIDDVAGHVSATMRVQGPLPSPDFEGEVTLTEGRFVLPALNTSVEAVDIKLAGRPGSRVTLVGGAKAGKGKLTLDGHIDDPLQATRSLALTLNGDSVLIADWPEYRVWASPQLNLHGDAKGWQIDGSIALPRAEIALRELPEDAVKPSADVVVVNRSAEVAPPGSFSGRVRVSAGERVHLQAAGVDTYISGDLLISKSAHAELGVEGQLALIKGVFSAFGQDLSVRKGTLTFGGPLDNPLIDVEAVRIIDEFGKKITAGIHIRGYRDDLTTTVFSEPAMGEADALSYLVAGRPLTGLSESQGGDLTSAALSLSISQAARITQEVGRKFGVDQLTTAGSGETLALVAGKELGPRLYARYAYGVFSQIGTLFLGYRLGEHLRLEAGAGENQTIDLLYSVEKP